MSFRDIRHAQAEIWPDVQESIRLQDASREAAQRHPHDLTKSARRRAKVDRDRVIANETVWAIAKANALATPEAAKVIEAARAWLADHGPAMVRYPEDYEESDFQLRDALNAYATTFHIDDDEGLTGEQLLATVIPHGNSN